MKPKPDQNITLGLLCKRQDININKIDVMNHYANFNIIFVILYPINAKLYN